MIETFELLNFDPDKYSNSEELTKTAKRVLIRVLGVNGEIVSAQSFLGNLLTEKEKELLPSNFQTQLILWFALATDEQIKEITKEITKP